jgi:hypothetical protein
LHRDHGVGECRRLGVVGDGYNLGPLQLDAFQAIGPGLLEQGQRD